MNPNIEMSLARSDEILAEMRREYERSLREHAVGPRAVHFTHEVAERLRSVLDRLARAYWETHIAPTLQGADRGKALIYFPITADINSFDSVLGRWRWKGVVAQHAKLRDYLLSLQPFTNPKNDWLRIINELALHSKHIDLLPQKRFEQRQVTVTRGGAGSVAWGPGVTFGTGVSVMGAPVDPRTQRIVPTPGVTETVETWVSFLIDGYGVDALSLCGNACRSVREIAAHMSREFNV